MVETSLISLAKKLISIPSYVDDEHNEIELGKFILNYIKSNARYLKASQQEVIDGRFNVIASDDHEPRLMFVCNMDTVIPSAGWKHCRVDESVEDGKLYGLGASDMKGAIACVLDVLTEFDQTKGLMLLFDIGEEHRFEGIKKFLEEYNVKPELAVFPEPGMAIRNGHRGVIDLKLTIYGVTGHAARPQFGKNAITLGISAIEASIKDFKAFDNPSFANTTCNIAHIKGGIYGGSDESGKAIILEKGNKIPDIAVLHLDIRTASEKLDGKKCVSIINTHLNSMGLRLGNAEVMVDYAPLFIPRSLLTKAERCAEAVLKGNLYADLGLFGFGEGQLLNSKNGTPCVYIGPGLPEMAHKVDEYVMVEDLERARELFRNLILSYCY
jgi:succinyl-diaminopimelate desuccinylase